MLWWVSIWKLWFLIVWEGLNSIREFVEWRFVLFVWFIVDFVVVWCIFDWSWFLVGGFFGFLVGEVEIGVLFLFLWLWIGCDNVEEILFGICWECFFEDFDLLVGCGGGSWGVYGFLGGIFLKVLKVIGFGVMFVFMEEGR